MSQKHQILTRENLESRIEFFRQQVDQLDNVLKAESPLKLMQQVKRKHVNKGPYPNVSYFEAANRILTDCIIFNSARMFLDKTYFPEIDYLKVDFGHNNTLDHDIIGFDNKNNIILVAEAFNTSESFFRSKMYKTKARLKDSNHNSIIKYIVYNEDACETFKPKDESIIHLKVPVLL